MVATDQLQRAKGSTPLVRAVQACGQSPGFRQLERMERDPTNLIGGPLTVPGVGEVAVLHVSLKHSPPWTKPFNSRAANTMIPRYKRSSS